MDANSLFNTIMGKAGYGIDQAVQTAKSGSMPGGAMGGVAVGGLAALLLTNKKSRKIGKKALKYGGAAALGGLAYKAWNDYKTTQTSAPTAAAATTPATAPAAPMPTGPMPDPPSGSIFDLAKGPQTPAGEDIRLSLIQAMISAAKADGHIDAQEQIRIEEKITVLDIGDDEKSFLVQQLHADSDPIEIARLSGSDEHAAELYLASALAIDLDTPEEARYLDRLSDALRLPSGLRAQLDAQAQGALVI